MGCRVQRAELGEHGADAGWRVQVLGSREQGLGSSVWVQSRGSREGRAERGVQGAGFGVQCVGAGFEKHGAGNGEQSEECRMQVLGCRPAAWHSAVLQGGSHQRRILCAWGWHSCRSHLRPAATPHPRLPAPPWHSSGLWLTRPAPPCPGRLRCPCQPCRPRAKPGAAPHHCCTHPSTMHGALEHLQLPGIMLPAQSLPHCHLPACLCSPGLPEGTVACWSPACQAQLQDVVGPRAGTAPGG